jgi:hypothetical protein
MRYTAVVRRRRAKGAALRLHFPTGGPGVFGVDLGEALAQLALRELLKDAGLLGRV